MMRARSSSTSSGGAFARDDDDTNDDPLMTEQERELERLREQLACLKRSSAAALAARREASAAASAASAAALRRSGFGGSTSSSNDDDNGGKGEEENYVVERRAARATLDKDEAQGPNEDPDVWPPPPPRKPDRTPAPRRPAAPPPQQPQPQPGLLWPQQQQQHHHHYQQQNGSPQPGTTGPIGRRPAVLSRLGGGTVLFPGGGGPGGGAAAPQSGVPSSTSSSSSFTFASLAVAMTPQRRHQHQPSLMPPSAAPAHQAPPPPPAFAFPPLLPPPPPFLLPHHHNHPHHRNGQLEDAALLAALERDVSASTLAPRTRWDDIAGLSAAKRVLQEAAVLPLLLPALFTGIRRPPKGVLLHGPPGTGKTMLARAVACEALPSANNNGGGGAASFLSASAATLASKYRGESERLVRALFSLARARAPCVVFLDEVDALCGQRGAEGEHEASRRFKAELLVQIDACAAMAQQLTEMTPRTEAGASKAPLPPPRHVLVLAATNHPWDLDDALRRRLEKRVYVPLPNMEERRELLQLCLKGVDSALSPSDLSALAKQLEGYSGDDVTAVCREAALEGVRRTVAGKSPAEVRAMVVAAAAGGGASAAAATKAAVAAGPVTREDFEAAVARVRPSVAAADAARHEAWSKEFGSA